MPVVVQIVLTALSGLMLGLALVPTTYLGLLAVVAGRHKPKVTSSRSTRFVFVVPAHNEEGGIAATVASLAAVDWPLDFVETIVVADNCTDGTAAGAEAAGATVLVRQHPQLRGKGYALEFGFSHVLQHTKADAVVVVDADTVVSPNLLSAFAARIGEGALAMQAEYGVRNVDASWRTEMMALALAMFHTLRSNARERLGLSAGLRGNGMCFTRACLERFPQQAFGLVEDVEHGLALGRGGVRIVAVVDAHVLGEMVASGAASESQRRRWEDGRTKLKTQVLPGVLMDALKTRSLMLFDLAMDLLIPPLSTVAVLVVCSLAVEGTRIALLGFSPWSAAALLPSGLLGLYVLRGMHLSGLGFRSVTVLLKAPAYVAWKLVLKLKGSAQKEEWVRTARETKPPPP